MDNKSFMGKGGFIWWTGVVENRKDPLNLGRCQVRIYGWHHEDKKTQIPTEDLPWAQPLLPINGGKMFSTPKEGDWVQGYFMDGEGGQYPIMIGILPTIPDTQPNPEKGFSDPRTESELKEAPVPPKPGAEYKKDGTGVKVENEEPKNYPKVDTEDPEPTTSRISRNEKIKETPFNDTLKNPEKKVKVATYKDINNNPLSIINKISNLPSTALGTFSSSMKSLFSNMFSITSLTDGMSGILPPSLFKIPVFDNLFSATQSALYSAMPSLSTAVENKPAINTSINSGMISSALTDLGVTGFNANNEKHIKAISSIPGLAGMDLSIPKQENIDTIKNSLSSSIPEIKESINSLTSNDIKTSLNSSGVDVNAIKSVLDSNGIDIKGLDTDKLSSNLETNGVSTFNGGKQSSAKEWSEPKSKYNAKYPYNNVTETESGHLFELDDTPKAERINIRHRTGTFMEYHPDGNAVHKVVKDKYEIVMGDDHVKIMGDCKVLVQGNANICVMKDCIVEIEGNLNTTIKKDWNLNIDGNVKWNVKGDIVTNAVGTAWHTAMKNYIAASGAKMTLSSGGDLSIDCASNIRSLSQKSTVITGFDDVNLISYKDIGAIAQTIRLKAPKITNN